MELTGCEGQTNLLSSMSLLHTFLLTRWWHGMGFLALPAHPWLTSCTATLPCLCPSPLTYAMALFSVSSISFSVYYLCERGWHGLRMALLSLSALQKHFPKTFVLYILWFFFAPFTPILYFLSMTLPSMCVWVTCVCLFLSSMLFGLPFLHHTH